MATKPVPPRPVPRLYLATPEIDDPAPLAAGLPQVLAGADVAAVLLRLKETDPRGMITRIKAIAPVVQASGAALLLDGHVELTARGGADGALGRFRERGGECLLCPAKLFRGGMAGDGRGGFFDGLAWWHRVTAPKNLSA